MIDVRKSEKKQINPSSQLDHKGSAMLTVILVVAFLTILATTLLYVTGMNFQIKQADYQNKKNFYSGETYVEQIRSGLLLEVSQAAQAAYLRTSEEFVALGSGDIRETQFRSYFVEEIENALNAHAASGWGTYLSGLCGPDCTISGTITTEKREANGIFTIRGIEMQYIDYDNGRATIISTDLEIHAPDVVWPTLSVDALGQIKGLDDEGFVAYNASGDPTMQAATAADAAKGKFTDITKCVRYTNWVKK